MLFDTSGRFAFSIVRQEANLINPNVSQDESTIATFAFNLTFFQFRRLNDALEEQFDGFFAIREQLMLPRASFFWQLLGGQDPPTGFLVKIGEEATTQGLVT